LTLRYAATSTIVGQGPRLDCDEGEPSVILIFISFAFLSGLERRVRLALARFYIVSSDP